MKKLASHSEKGFSLLELSTALFSLSVVTLGSMAIMAMAFQFFHLTSESLQTDLELTQGGRVLKQYLTQAVDLRFKRGCSERHATQNHSRNGVLWHCNQKATPNPDSGQCNYIAVFHRENGQRSSDIEPTAMINCQGTAYKSGTVWILNHHSEMSGDRYNLTPQKNYPAVAIHRLTGDLNPNMVKVYDWRQRRIRLADTGPIGVTDDMSVVTADFTLTARYFIGGALKDWSWCSNFSVSEELCTPTVTFRDISKTIRIVFRNAAIFEQDAGLLGRRLFGSVYFFRPQMPQTVCKGGTGC